MTRPDSPKQANLQRRVGQRAEEVAAVSLADLELWEYGLQMRDR